MVLRIESVTSMAVLAPATVDTSRRLSARRYVSPPALS
jgi:hypothetical protein